MHWQFDIGNDLEPTLLAVDLGLRTGMALYGHKSGLMWYRSRNFGTRQRLRKAVFSLLNEIENLQHIVIEGGGELLTIWQKEADRRNINLAVVDAAMWRSPLLYPREQTTGTRAKNSADSLARRTIEWSGAARPTSLRHDAAEAIVIGLWYMLEIGWLHEEPPFLQR
jgi:hypothetical protein